jgi:GNAT superfamily N-acetyltransferase
LSRVPEHPLGNFLSGLRLESADQIAAVFGRCDDVLGSPCQRVVIDADTPPAAEAYLALCDWHLDIQLLLMLPGSVTPEPPARPLRAVGTSDDDWSDIGALFRIDHLEEDARAGRPARPLAVTTAAVRLRRSLTPAATYFMAEEGGEICGFIAAWVSEEGVGIIEDVFVRPDARGAGLATQMLRFAVAYARSRGAGPVLIGADVDDTPKNLYARFGFRPVAVVRSYVRPA